MGGGYQLGGFVDDLQHRPFVNASYPKDVHTWRVEATNNTDPSIGYDLQVIVHAVCESAG
jgi:hypothetical protein